jgi:hypothetical protein
MRKILLPLLAALLLSPAVQALQIESTTTVSDDQGGTLVISSQGEAFADAGSSTSQLVASNFSPRGDGSINAELTRTRSRGGETMSSVYSGSATLAGTNPEGESVSVELELVDVAVARSGDGPELSGVVIINGETLNAADLPERARGLLGRVLRLFAFD